jgi:hypothetical protein
MQIPNGNNITGDHHEKIAPAFDRSASEYGHRERLYLYMPRIVGVLENVGQEPTLRTMNLS